MELQDLFKKRDNYVEEPTQVIDPLQQFFAERTSKLDVPATSRVSPKAFTKIEEPVVDEIYQQYSPDLAPTYSSEMQSQVTRQPSTAESQYVPVSNLIDVERIKKQAEVLAPKETDWKDALANLTPLAVEALLGKGGGASLGISGQAILGDIAKRSAKRDTLEAKLMELKALKQPKTDVEAGRQARFEASQKQRKEFEDRKIALDARNKLNQDKDYIANKGRYNATNDAINILNKKSWAGDQGVGFLFAKGIFREVGSLTNEERTAFIADPALSNKFDMLYTKYIQKGAGTFTEQDRKDLTELAVHMREQAKKDMNRVASGYIEGTKSVGVDPSGVINPLLATKDIQAKFINTGSKNRPKQVTQNGITYTLNEKTGKYE